MTPVRQLSDVEDELRDAIAAGAFQQARPLVGEYCRAAESALAGLAPAQQQDLARRVVEVLQWAERSVRCERAIVSSRLRELPAWAAYGSPSANTNRHWQIEG
jgi:hypothetical protein